MRLRFIIALLFIPIAIILGADLPPPAKSTIPEIVTTKNERYTKVVVTKVNANLVSFEHADGFSSLMLSQFDEANLDRLFPGYITFKKNAAAAEVAKQKAQEERRLAVAKQEEEAVMQTAKAEANRHAEETRQSKRKSTFTGWTMSSDGHTWNSAPESEKLSLCRKLASVGRKGNSAAFYYDALDGIYRNGDDYRLRQSIDDVMRFIEGASSSLPLNQRNY